MAMFFDEAVACVGFDATDEARLRALHAALGADVPALAAALVGIAGPSDARFCEACARVGADHAARDRAAHELVLAAAGARAAYADGIARVYRGDDAHAVARSVDKLVDLELALALRGYRRQTERRAHRDHADRSDAMHVLWSGLAHELRNPLNSARLQLDVLARRLVRCVADAKLVEPAELARYEVERLTALVDDFLVVAQPPPLAAAAIDVVTVIEHVVELEHALAERGGIELRAIAPESRVQARVDADKLHQIVRNLVRNAIEAAPRGGHVHVDVATDVERVHVRVSDDGPGIPAAVRARIYEPFFTTKGGTGLGLAIVHSLVAMHRGTIEVASGADGTRFDVALPRAA